MLVRTTQPTLQISQCFSWFAWLPILIFVFFLHVMQIGIVGRLLVNICSRWSYFLSVYFQWFRIFRFTSDTLPEGCAGGGGGSSSFDWHSWLLIQGLGLVKSWQILMLSSSSHFPTATVNQQKLQQQRKSLSCWTVINIIHLFMQNHNLRQRVIFIDIDSNMSSTKTIQTIFIWYICC